MIWGMPLLGLGCLAITFQWVSISPPPFWPESSILSVLLWRFRTGKEMRGRPVLGFHCLEDQAHLHHWLGLRPGVTPLIPRRLSYLSGETKLTHSSQVVVKFKLFFPLPIITFAWITPAHTSGLSWDVTSSRSLLSTLGRILLWGLTSLFFSCHSCFHATSHCVSCPLNCKLCADKNQICLACGIQHSDWAHYLLLLFVE